jgi:hypothetical protein
MGSHTRRSKQVIRNLSRLGRYSPGHLLAMCTIPEKELRVEIPINTNACLPAMDHHFRRADGNLPLGPQTIFDSFEPLPFSHLFRMPFDRCSLYQNREQQELRRSKPNFAQRSGKTFGIRPASRNPYFLIPLSGLPTIQQQSGNSRVLSAM